MTRAAGSACLIALAVIALPIGAHAQELIHRVVPGANEAFAGASVGAAGDVNGDGLDDFTVTLMDVSSAAPCVKVNVHSGADASVLASITPPANLAGVYHTDGIGDVNGDGTDDVIVGARAGFATFGALGGVAGGFAPTQFPMTMFGDVTIYSGVDGSVIRTFLDPGTTTAGFGSSFAVLGDVNGDGVKDVAISDPHSSTNGLNLNGTVYVFDSLTGLVISSVHGTQTWQAFGLVVRAAGDADGDGSADLLALHTAPQTTVTSTSFDEARIHSGSTGALIKTIANSATQSMMRGSAVDGGEDIDGDGVADVVFGTPWGMVQNRGEINAYSGADGSLLFSVNGQPCQGIGSSLGLADVTGDGLADVISGNVPDVPTIAKQGNVIDGMTGTVLIDGLAGAVDVLTFVAVGDVDGDGIIDLALDRDVWMPQAAVEIYAGGPALASQADSMVGASSGAPEDVLKINGSSGGGVHCVGCDMGTTITFSVDQPSMNAQPADFVLFGRVGVPFNDERYVVPTVTGDMVLVPAPMATWAIPMVFTLASSVGPMPGGVVLATPPAPWSYSVPGGINFPMELTLQGVILESPTNAVATNAIIVRVR